MTQELYALGKDRSRKSALDFLDRFLPKRDPVSSDYPIPESEDEQRVIFESDEEILAYLEAHRNEPYAIYWNHSDPDSYDQAMLFFTRDGYVIFGLTCEDEISEPKMRELRDFVGTEWAIKGWEQRPPDSSEEFIKLIQQASSLNSGDR